MIDSMLVPPTRPTACAASRWASSPRRTSRSSGGARCSTRRSSSSSPTSSGTSPTSSLVDLPPGTGDISLSLAQFLPRAEVYVVTTPQPAAQKVAQRAGFMAQKVNLEVKGVIENMSWFTGDDGKRYELFGAGGGDELAELLGVPLLGQVPLVAELREGGDAGRPIVLTDPGGEAAQAFAAIAEQIEVELAPTRRYRKELKLL